MKTIGVGGSSIQEELDKIRPKAHLAKPIEKAEFQTRIDKACKLMKTENVNAIYLHAGTNLFYFTGTRWGVSERMVGAILFSNGTLHYIVPEFERGTVLDFMQIEGEVHGWHEHESPYALFCDVLSQNGITEGAIYIDETTPFFVTDGILKVGASYTLVNANAIISGCRTMKSSAEIAIMQVAMDITMEVQKAAARIMHVGISAKAVEDFIHEAHKRYGIASGSYFCIVLFGVDSSFPHGVKSPKNLEENDMVLVDTGCVLHDYISDITRTYVFGEPNDLQRRIWNIEKEAQLVAFQAAQLGATCDAVDSKVRELIASYGLGPDYNLPGLPHRTGHGIGLDIHEYPYIVKGNATVLKPGMCFSNEPMLCVPNEFGVRLEDHIYMSENGSQWFTEPALSIEDPFGLAKP
ncbi:M24 family metallopeptidase [Snuella sedimenti]|uniref:Aminopeptidase P family protein n=1 Tax=Snuella sedimenti TaxID=2798802 RepID=A0A8J7IFE0_9FLAO|nr:Xaa-Pro peptidase family protein [Snuella sedimenti]MBJ6367727.1 aminopeptidase P family protein [Snuella sedimenti]